MNITQKLYNKVHLNELALMIFFYILCTLVPLILIKYLFHSKLCLVCHLLKDSFLKWSCWKFHYTLTYSMEISPWLAQTKLENWLHISTESPKEGFDDTVFQHFLDELKHCNPDMNGLTTSSSIFVFIFNMFGCYVIF